MSGWQALGGFQPPKPGGVTTVSSLLIANVAGDLLAFGGMLGVPLLVDPEVLGHQTVLFAAGLETESVRVAAGELFRDEPLTMQQLTRWDGPASEEPIT